MGKKHKYVAKQSSNKHAPPEERHEPEPPEVLVAEGLRFQELISLSRDNINRRQATCYILSVKWLNSWKDYTGYELLIKGEDPNTHKSFGKKRPGKLNTDLLMKDEKKFTLVPEELPEYAFLNAVFDTDMQRDKDYITVDSAVFTLLHEKYGGNVIQRPVRHVKSGNAYVDVEMHDFTICFVGPKDIEDIRKATEAETKKRPDSLVGMKKMQVSSIWKLQQFKAFLSEYVKAVYEVDRAPEEIRVWKFENFLSLLEMKEQLIKAYRTEQHYISGKELTEESVGQYDLDDYIKSTTAIFIEFNDITFAEFKLPEGNFKGYCQDCLEVKELSKRCPCDSVFYCSLKCMYNDKQFHFKTCGSAYDSDDDEQYLKLKVDSKEGCLSGLDNLGNTCYMNATLQCLSNIPQLAEFFLKNEYLSHLDPKEVQQNNAIFIKKFAKFIKKMYSAKPKTSFEPWSIKMQISYFIKIFKGYDQHDANDLIIYTLNTLNDFCSKPENSNYAQFLVDTFLGEFNSNVSCPQCERISITKDPFLGVSVPLKSKQAVRQISYCIVLAWNNYVTGVFEVVETWEQVWKIIGINDDGQLLKMIGTMRELEDESPEDFYKKWKKDTLILFPGLKAKAGYEIELSMNTLRVLGGNQTKSAFGRQLYVRVPGIEHVSSIYTELVRLFGLPEEVVAQLESFSANCQKKLSDLLESFNKEDDETKETEPSEQKQPPKKPTQKQQEEKQKQNHKLIGELESANNKEFQELFDGLFKFKVYVKSHRKSKRNCDYCGKKCNGCRLPFLINETVKEYIEKGEDFKIEVVFDQNQPLHEESRTPPFHQYTTLEECLEEFSIPEQLDEENAWYCDICDNMRLAYKQLSIEQYPKVLLLQLKRFKQQPNNNKKVKNNEIIEYPQLLELAGGSIKYKLNGIVIHEGSLEGGHYWAVCEKEGRYFCFNDDHVKETEYFHKNAYILFYTML